MMKAFVPAPMLEWHYRSRDERLIAFSNREIYDNRLITFPGPGRGEAAVKPSGICAAGSGSSSRRWSTI